MFFASMSSHEVDAFLKSVSRRAVLGATCHKVNCATHFGLGALFSTKLEVTIDRPAILPLTLSLFCPLSLLVDAPVMALLTLTSILEAEIMNHHTTSCSIVCVLKLEARASSQAESGPGPIDYATAAKVYEVGVT